MGIDITSVADGKTIPRLQYRLTYNGVELNGIPYNYIAHQIFTCATSELATVFNDERLNSMVLAIFKANYILGDSETKFLEQLDLTTVEWAVQFLNLLSVTYNTSQALQQLCNINDEGNQLQIHKALQNSQNKTLSFVKVVEIR